MAYPQGINFRATAGFVTDTSPATYELATNTNYPRTTPQGNTVGWENPGPGNVRDRTTGNDARLAGCHFNTTVGLCYRFDLPSAGSYNIRAAFGDPTSQNATAWSLLDTSTVLATLATGDNGAANSFRDATNAVLTAAAWPAGNTAKAATFSTTICRIRSDSASNNMIAHAYVESAAPATPSGTLASTLAGVALAASGQNICSGSFSSTLAGITISSSGLVGTPPSGVLAATLGGASMNGSGAQTDNGTFAATVGGIAASISGSASPHASGTLAVTLAGAGMNASGFQGSAPPQAPTSYRRRAPHRMIQ